MPEMIRKVISFEIKEVGDRVLEFVGSTEDTDRVGDIIQASGWQLKNYKKNPVFLWAHQYDAPPVGKAVKVWLDDSRLKFHIEFAKREDYEFADTIYKLYKGGFLRATSVGFMPIASEPIEVKDEDVMLGHSPTRYLKQDLLELSGCPVPANPNALAEAKTKGLITDKQMKVLEEVTEDLTEKPYPNEHACRLKDPDDFQEGTFKRTEREHEGKKYSIIMGKLKDETAMTEQAYRYDKEAWTAAEAKSHCTEHEGTFEPAQESKAAFECECIECGYKMGSDEHCNELKCPKCGGDMRRVERPGPGKEATVSQASIADEIDYLAKAVEDEGLNDENKLAAWGLVRWIMRLAGDDIPVDIAEKIGAVLNKANRERLGKIQSLAQEVLDSAQTEEPEKIEPSLTEADIQAIVQASVEAVVNQAKGKLRR